MDQGECDKMRSSSLARIVIYLEKKSYNSVLCASFDLE